MPARSKAQRRAIAIAKNQPEKLYDRNRGLLKMSDKDMEDYATSSEKGLPYKKKGGDRPAMGRGGMRKKGSRKGRRMGRSGGSRY